MKWAVLVIGAGLSLASPAQAETLHLSGTAPAGSDAAAAQRSIAVERFGGQDGARLAFLIEGQLRDAYVTPEPYFSVLTPALANEADAVLQGFADPRLAESEFLAERETCIERAENGTCLKTGLVETQCLRVSASLRPSLRLVAREGEVLWSGEPARSQDFSWCPEFDEAPAIDPVIDSWLEASAAEVRFALAPHNWARNVRIMERSSGLSRPARQTFRNAIRIIEHDPYGACMNFTQLLAENPAHPSLTFNVGLCAEAQGDHVTAESHYRAALTHRNSDDECRAGLNRLAQRRRAEWQMASREVR